MEAIPALPASPPAEAPLRIRILLHLVETFQVDLARYREDAYSLEVLDGSVTGNVVVSFFPPPPLAQAHPRRHRVRRWCFPRAHLFPPEV